MNYKKVLNDYIDTFLNLIYPRNIYCILCNKAIKRDERYSLCNKCFESISFIGLKACNKCGKSLEKEYLLEDCHECIQQDHYFTRAISCVEYDEISKKIIFDLKYNKKRYLSYHMAEIMANRIKSFGKMDIDIIIPVPMYRKKEKRRSFNQAYLIASFFGKMMNIKVDKKILIKIKDTEAQNKLKKDERKKNLKNVFEFVSNKDIEGKNILLIDDVYTTGSTVDECSRILRKSGVSNIYVLTFATGRNL